MNSIHSVQDLQQFGINYLTGEACGFSMRMLCDVNEDGAALLAEFLGIKETAFQENWNSTVNGKPAVGSVMLSRGVVPDLAVFAFFRQGVCAVVLWGTDIIPVEDAARLADYERAVEDNAIRRVTEIRRNPKWSGKLETLPSRNVHQMTGRLV